MKCELCEKVSCFDQEKGRIMVYNNGKEMWSEDNQTAISACIIRQRHVQKELHGYINKARQNLL